MSLDLTFKQVCEHIQKEQPELLEATDKLLGIALVCSPIVLGPLGFGLLPLIAAKNELTKVGKNILERFSKTKDADYLARQTRMQVAYGLICFTAFFEALDRQIPQNIRDKIRLLTDEKVYLAKEGHSRASRSSSRQETLPTSENITADRFVSFPIPLPHPTESLSDQQERLSLLYQQMAAGFKDFIQKLAFWDDADEKMQALVSKAVEKIPQLALACYEAQYFELARKFEDFAIWANLQEHKKTKQLIESLSDYVQRYAELTNIAKSTIDIGLVNLHETVIRIPATLQTSQAAEIVEGLRKHYLARINEPIIDDKDDPSEDRPKLSFPKIRDAFVPQSFLILRQGAKAIALEEPETWKDLPRRDDLAAFLLSYLSSPYSTEAPLVILGHPGSGKSLLTTVLSAQLLSPYYAPIRVPLREVNSDAGIVAQIEEHISRVTSIHLDSWAKVSGSFRNNPPLVILDGYDELLQASGKVFAGYLKDVQTFQKNEAEQGRPVRVIVTSRVTLIDKAFIPQGSTIVRLLEFSKEQRNRWISIWNTANSIYFESSKVKPFELPREDQPEGNRIISLAEQPLLLLMLALYDSEGNKLRDTKIRDRTVLYESLLRRFVLRERAKSKSFLDLLERDKVKEVDADMRRLGVASIGMYNRRKLYILSSELNADLKFFDLERRVSVEGAKALTSADLLLGSFFFVHKSKALQKSATAEQDELSAFEFLHNTFGEFLAADFIIRQALVEAQELIALGSNDDLRVQRERKLRDADGLSRAWFASLVYTPLFTRPVVLEMIREWLGHVLQRRKLSKKAFLSELDAIVHYQLARILSRREMPSIMQKEQAEEGFRAAFENYALLGHMAIYSINLLILRSVMSSEPYVFDEGRIASSEDGARPWDQLTHLWRSWFSMDNLNGITAVFFCERNDTKVKIMPKDKILTAESGSRLETIFNIGSSLSDAILAGVSGLVLHGGVRQGQIDLQAIRNYLKSENIDSESYVAIRELEQASFVGTDRLDEVLDKVRRAFEIAARNDNHADLIRVMTVLKRVLRYYGDVGATSSRGVYLRDVSDELARYFVDILRDIFDRTSYSNAGSYYIELAGDFIEAIRQVSNLRSIERFEEEIFHRALHPRMLADVIERAPWAVMDILRIFELAGSGSRRWYREFGEELFGRIVDVRSGDEWIGRRPELVIGLIQLAEKFGGEGSERFGEEMLERFLRQVDTEELVYRRPEVAIKLLTVMRRVRGQRMWSELGGGMLRRLMHGGLHAIEIGRAAPELVTELIELAVESGSREWAERFFEELIGDRFWAERIIYFARHQTPTLARMLRCVRLLNSQRGVEIIKDGLNDILDQPGGASLLWSSMPLSAFGDLRWLADITDDRKMRSLVNHLDADQRMEARPRR